MPLFDVELYMKLTGLEGLIKVGDEPDLTLLKLLVKHQVLNVAYQNHDMQNTRTECDLTPSSLLKRMLADRRRGGMCFEGSEFMFAVLKEFGFDARRIPCFVMVHENVYTEGEWDHHIIIVHLQGKKYLVDASFSVNTVREPLEFSFEQTEERVVIPNVEQYRLECHEDYYRLNLWLKGNFAPMYRFQRPLTYMNDEQCLANYRRFLATPIHVPIRDGIMKVGIVTEKGRKGFICTYDSKSQRGKGPYTMVLGENNQVATSEKVPYEKFKAGVESIVEIKLNDDHFER